MFIVVGAWRRRVPWGVCVCERLHMSADVGTERLPEQPKSEYLQSHFGLFSRRKSMDGNFKAQSKQSSSCYGCQAVYAKANMLAFRLNWPRKDLRKSLSPKPGYWMWWMVTPGAPRNALMHAYLPALLLLHAGFCQFSLPHMQQGSLSAAFPSGWPANARLLSPGNHAASCWGRFTPHI